MTHQPAVVGDQGARDRHDASNEGRGVRGDEDVAGLEPFECLLGDAVMQARPCTKPSPRPVPVARPRLGAYPLGLEGLLELELHEDRGPSSSAMGVGKTPGSGGGPSSSPSWAGAPSASAASV